MIILRAKDAPLEKVAPLLCAGVTTYAPLIHNKVTKEDKIAVAGFGGLGHMAVQYAVAMAAEVTVFNISEVKKNKAIEMGATKYVNTSYPTEMQSFDNQFKLILSTIPVNYDVAIVYANVETEWENVYSWYACQ